MRLVLTDAVRRPALLRRCATVAAAAATVLAAVAPLAVAAPTPGYGALTVPGGTTSSFAPEGGGLGQLGSPPGHVAVENATGNVLVADPAHGRVEVFQPDLSVGGTNGGTAAYLTQFAVASPFGLAIDQSNGAVYVSDGNASAGRIVRFVSDGAPTPTYTEDPSFVSPVLGSGPCGLSTCDVGDFHSALAVDPTTGELLVADRGNNRVSRYTSTGAFVRTFRGTDVPSGQFNDLMDVAAGSGAIYVLDQSPGSNIGNFAAKTRILQFDAGGAYGQTLDGTDVTALAVDSHGDRLVATSEPKFLGNLGQIRVYSGHSVAVTSSLPGQGSENTIGVAVDGGASRRAYAVTDHTAQPTLGVVGVQVLAPTPGAEADGFTAPTPRAAHLTGVVNPDGRAATAHFEYCRQDDACATDPVNNPWTVAPTPDVAVGSDNADHPIAADIIGLRAASPYSVRVVVTAPDTGASSATAAVTVRTAPEAPTVVTGSTTDLTSTGVTLTGAVTPFGVQTTYSFEYGESTSYGQRVPTSAAGVAGNGYVARNVTRAVSGLQPGTLYHYRLVAANVGGTTLGADATFTTDAAGDQAIGYEMVSPVDKLGVAVNDLDFSAGFQAREDGDAIVYSTQKEAFPGSESAPLVPRVLGARSADGWSTTPLDAPFSNVSGADDLLYSTVAVSKDLRRALVLGTKKLTDDAVEGRWNLYLRELPANRLTLVASDDRLFSLVGSGNGGNMVGTYDSGRSLVFIEGSTGGQMYDVSVSKGFQVVSRLPDGTAVDASTSVSQLHDPHQVSEDGSRVFFTAVSSGQNAGLFLRQNGTTTVPISVSHRAGAPATPIPALFLDATPDGRYVIFTSPGPQPALTDDAPGGFYNNAYRYDVETDTMTYLATGVDAAGGISADAETGKVFFQDAGKVMYAHDGVITEVADVGGALFMAQLLSPNGRYELFLTTARLTSFDNAGHWEAYRYDTDTGDLTCPSCRTDGGVGTGDAQFGQDAQLGRSQLNRVVPRSVLDDGTVFFDTTDPLVGADVNGTRDVYSWRAGRAKLISRGTQPTTSTFVEATPDGRNVFFVTGDRLVGQDQDDTADLYDARVGGGIAAQSPAAGAAPCGGSECRDVGGGPTTPPSPPTQVASPPPAKAPTIPRAKISVLRSSFSSTTLILTMQVSGRGRLRAAGGTVRATTRTVPKAGTYILKVPLSRQTRSARKARRRVRVTVRVSLTPPFAAVTSIKLTRTLGK
jgi:hypothetical protein